jgi:acetyltransferase-like isoleucine patch superfamily enzyme
MIKAILLAALPPFLSVPIRRLMGAKIAGTARIGWLSVVAVDHLTLDEHATIARFAVVRARHLTMGRHALVKSFALVSAHTVVLGESVHIAPLAVIHATTALEKSRITIGDHSRIFPFCWIEPGEGIEIGNQVGIGGHGLIFTHGAWSDYLRGGPVGYGPVKIEDNVWLPWRVSILTGVTVGANSIIMSGSVVTRSIPPNVIAGGSPAKVIKEGGAAGLDDESSRKRAREILDAFAEWHTEAKKTPLRRKIALDDATGLGQGDLLFAVTQRVDPAAVQSLVARGVSIVDHSTLTFYRASGEAYLDDFREFIRRYGIRVYLR